MTVTSQLTVNTGAAHPITVNQSGVTTGNDVMFQKSSVNVFSIGTNETSLETYTWTPAARDYKIGTSNTERLRIPSAGIANDNTATSLLAVQGTTMVYKNNVLDTSTAQTLTNKTIDTAGPNTIQIGGVNITSLVDQAVLSTSSPTFASVNLVGGISEFGGEFTQQFTTLTTTDGSTVTLVPLTIPAGTVQEVIIYLMAFCSAGANLNGSVGSRQIVRLSNLAGTVTVAITNTASSESFASGLTTAATGVNTAAVRVTGIASNTIRWTALVKIYDE